MYNSFGTLKFETFYIVRSTLRCKFRGKPELGRILYTVHQQHRFESNSDLNREILIYAKEMKIQSITHILNVQCKALSILYTTNL